MHFGIFVEEMRQGGLGPAAAFREAFEVAEHADAWGYDCVWLGEIHFAPTRSVISASLQVASSIATRTKRLRVGTAVSVLPLNHPLRIAEEVATLDHISGGRLEFGIGRSGVVRSYDIYGIPYGESQARFKEALEIIKLAWTGAPVQYEGQFYKINGAVVSPTPFQTPHPPMRMATSSHETFPAVGKMGMPSFIGLRAAEIPDLQADLVEYRRAWRDAGHPGDPSVYLRIPVYTTTSEKGAVEEPRESLSAFFGRQTELAKSAIGRAGTSKERQVQAERMARLTYEDILEKKVISGTPPRVIERLKALREALGIDGIVAEMNPGGKIPAELETRSMRLLAEEVIPAFR
jgi:alkanesulfonate monooxygenase SsuD/methylene tetrahydromethanopterin reductase-like flavin-dependent oxidoreductase (luciferase family)